MSEESPVTKPIPKPRAQRSVSRSQKLPESTDHSFCSWSSDTNVQPRDRSCSYSPEQRPQPKPRRARSVLFTDNRCTASADSSPQAHRLTQGPAALPTGSQQQHTTHKQSQVPETIKTLPASPKTLKDFLPFHSKTSFKDIFIKRQRASSDTKAIRKPPPPERPPPYVPKKMQHSLKTFQSKTPPARHPPHLVSAESTSPLRNTNAYTPSPSLSRSNVIPKCTEDSKAQNIDLFKVTRQNIIETGSVCHDYEDVDSSLTKRFDSSSSLEYKEPESSQLVTTLSSAPALPPRSTPSVPAKKHRLLVSPIYTENSANSPKTKLDEQDNEDYESTDDKEFDCESDDSYTSMDLGRSRFRQLDSDCGLQDQQEDVYIVMNPTEFIQPKKYH